MVRFNVYRSEQVEGGAVRLNGALVPARAPGSVIGATYAGLDESVEAGVPYAYWMEDIDVRGQSTFHGPVWVTVSSKPGYRIYLPLISTKAKGSP